MTQAQATPSFPVQYSKAGSFALPPFSIGRPFPSSSAALNSACRCHAPAEERAAANSAIQQTECVSAS